MRGYCRRRLKPDSDMLIYFSPAMAELVPAIHALLCDCQEGVDARDIARRRRPDVAGMTTEMIRSERNQISLT
jgi:hypothetical protein